MLVSKKIKTNREKTSILIVLKHKYKGVLPCTITAFDENKPLAIYHKFKYNFKTEDEYTINLPISPEELILTMNFDNELKPSNIDISINIYSLSTSKLIKYDKRILEILPFVYQLSENSGILEPNTLVYSENGNYCVRILPSIIENGKEINSPAYINQDSKRITIGKSRFNDLTINGRILVLLHEFGHGFLSKDENSEIEADINAINIMLSEGFNVNEIFNSYIEIFKNSKNQNNIRRYIDIKEYINNQVNNNKLNKFI